MRLHSAARLMLGVAERMIVSSSPEFALSEPAGASPQASSSRKKKLSPPWMESSGAANIPQGPVGVFSSPVKELDVYDASDRKHIRRAEKQSKVIEAQRHATLRTIMATLEGRAWMYDLIASCNVFHTPFTGEDPKTNFNCGVQSVGLRHFGEVVSVCPDYYILMMREANERDVAEDKRSESTPPTVAESEVDEDKTE